MIIWKHDRKLTWSDYEAYLEQGTPVGAGSAVGIRCESYSHSEEKILMKVVAYFEKKKSGVWPEKASERGLIHEQGHFDLAEIFSRKMRVELLQCQYKFNSNEFADMILKLHKLYSDSLIYFHNRYDIETQHSINTLKQKEWELYIWQELKKLEKYSNYFVTVYFKKL